MKRKKLGIYLATILFGTVLINTIPESHEAASTGLSIYNVTGTEFIDTKKDGIYQPLQLDRPLANQTVALYKAIDQAKAELSPIKTTKTNGIGTYSFSRLTKGTYFIRYGNQNDYLPVNQKNTIIDSEGNSLNGIVQVNVNKIATTANLAVTKQSKVNFHMFSDSNADGLLNNDEKYLNNKSVIIVDLLKLVNTLNTTGLEVNQEDLMNQVINGKGSLDMADGAIMFRTSKNNQPIVMNDLEGGLYVAFRSPFNIQLLELITNYDNILLLLELISGGDIDGLIENADLLGTGDLTTTPDTQYLKDIAKFFKKATQEVDSLNLGKYLGETNSNKLSTALRKSYSFSTLLKNIPGMKIIAADSYGNVYDASNLVMRKENNFYFGIKSLISVKGYVYQDLNGNGLKDTGESVQSMTLTAYDRYGSIISSITTPARTAYTLKNLPFNEDIYLVAETEEKVMPNVDKTNSIPKALNGKNIVAIYNKATTHPETEIKLDIGIQPH